MDLDGVKVMSSSEEDDEKTEEEEDIPDPSDVPEFQIQSTQMILTRKELMMATIQGELFQNNQKMRTMRRQVQIQRK